MAYGKPQSGKCGDANRPYRVVVALSMYSVAGRRKLDGIFDFRAEGHPWQMIIYRTRNEFTADVVRAELARGAKGFLIGMSQSEDTLAALVDSNVPTVLLSVDEGPLANRLRNLAIVKSDSQTIGREAALAMLKQGIYKSYGYVSNRADSDWSRERGRAWRDVLQGAGFVGRMFDATHFCERLQDEQTLLEWIRELPKPAGILAACDDNAFEVIDICNRNGIGVPSEVGVLGIDNDRVLCDNSTPKLSSVQPDFLKEGYSACQILERMMSARAPMKYSPRTTLIGIRSIQHRGSTVAESNVGRFVQQVLAYIAKNACSGIGVEDVASHFKVSSSLLELRFKQLQGHSLYETMLKIRLDEVKRRLRHTNDSISSITAACGWENPVPLKILFKRRFGVTMKAYREQPSDRKL